MSSTFVSIEDTIHAEKLGEVVQAIVEVVSGHKVCLLH